VAVSGAPSAVLAATTFQAQALNTLALAQCRVGQYQDALDTLKRSAALRPADSSDLVVSVLARLRLGRGTAARADFANLEALPHPGPDLRVLIAEAETLAAHR